MRQRDEYEYPDRGDTLTAAMIGASGLTPDQWTQQEADVLAEFRGELTTLQPRQCLLDLGSGEGRLTGEFADLFPRIVSVEPDPDRRAAQARWLAARSYHDSVELRADPPPAAVFDAALCSHVVQHVTAATTAGLLGLLSKQVRSGGRLLLLTTLSPISRYAVSTFAEDGREQETPISLDEFEAACATFAPHTLPIRFFTREELTGLLASYSFTVDRALGFHGLPDHLPHRDIAVFATRD